SDIRRNSNSALENNNTQFINNDVNHKKESLYEFSSDALNMFDDCYESSDDLCNIIPSFTNKPHHEVISLKNVISGAFSILTGGNKTSDTTDNQLQCRRSDVSFLEFGENGDVVIDSSVYMPSAPFFDPVGIDYGVYKELLEAEPPVWLPDSSATACMRCSALFTALTCGRHHCRFCGGVAKHDVMDWTCSRGWLNLPIGLSMEHEIFKSSNTLRSYCKVFFFTIALFKFALSE
ncbi:RING/FYVE/PHD-type zinc finger protein, partial [Trifolium medium]|nr:RING/FYVE/PHD-type zinc finger protein [Trifolium medium]